MDRVGFLGRLKTAIEFRETTDNAISEAAGLGRDYVRDLKRSRTKSPTVDAAEKLANALRCEPSWLIFGQGDPPWLEDSSGGRASLARKIDAKIATNPNALEIISQFVDVIASAPPPPDDKSAITPDIPRRKTRRA